jgi:glucose-1-phosphate thymidylyltransferase
MKGIILSGGMGSRLYPLTTATNKQLLPVYDKPMIYYPLCTMINFGIREFCIISTEQYIESYKKIFKDGNHLGLDICYKIQKYPKGIAESFIISKDFIKDSNVGLILGDNIFHGTTTINISIDGALIFAYEVSNPTSYGVIQFDKVGKVISLEEKPAKPKSNFCVPGLYFYDNSVIEYVNLLKPSKRNELEITDLNKIYLKQNKLTAIKLQKGSVWLDAGTPESLYQSSAYIQTIQERQGIKIGCVEEEVYKNKLIDDIQLKKIINTLPQSDYKKYLERLL